MRDQVRLPKELFQYPLARDPRIVTKWRRGHTAGIDAEWVAPLTGNEDVTLKWLWPKRLPWERNYKQEPRAPLALDTTLLFRLFQIMQSPQQFQVGPKKVYVEGNTLYADKLSRFLPRATQVTFPYHCQDSFRLWAHLSIRFPGLDMPPPIQQIEGENWRSPVKFVISPIWLEEIKKGRQIVLPLPVVATPQNMILKTWFYGSQKKVHINDWFYSVSGNKRGKKTTPHTPYESWLIVKQWYEYAKGEISWQRDPYTAKPKGKDQVVYVPSRYMDITVARRKRNRLKGNDSDGNLPSQFQHG